MVSLNTAAQYLIGIVIFAMIIIGGISMIGELGVNNAHIENSKYKSFNSTFNVMNKISEQTNGMKETIQTTGRDPSLFGALVSMLGATTNSIILLFSSMIFMNTIFGGLYTFFGIPLWVGNAFITIITIIIVFVIFAITFRMPQ